MLMDQAAAAVTPRTRAIMPVHLNGLAADLDAVYALAKKHDLRVIEDAAQAIGTEYKGTQDRFLRRHRGVQLPRQQEPHHHRRRAPCPWPRAEEAKRLEILRFHGITKFPDGTMDVTRGRQQAQHDRCGRAGRHRPAAAPG